MTYGCILLKFYIKPQPDYVIEVPCGVVSYWNSTSNHNGSGSMSLGDPVVSYWNSTSNHNFNVPRPRFSPLYLIEILHQTTTRRYVLGLLGCCILLKFYIKPQHRISTTRIFPVVSYWNSTSNHNSRYSDWLETFVVSYWNSTSNHNFLGYMSRPSALYLIEILHQTTTAGSP